MSRWLTIIAALGLGACSLSPERIAEVDALIEAERGRIDLAAGSAPTRIASPLDGLAEVAAGQDGHHLLPVEQGSDALALRIHLIRSADQHVELMNYIFYDDEAGELLLAELIDAARRGVVVRILVDSLFSLENPGLLARLALLDMPFEIRLYNPVFGRSMIGDLAFTGAIACCFKTLNHRLHHKLLTVDGRHGLVGGRNTADRYFDLDTRVNFLDMEVLVTGPVVADMVSDFDHFWAHERSRPAQHTRDVAALLGNDQAEALELARDNRAAYALDMLADAGWLEPWLERAGLWVGAVRYFSDPPDKRWRLDEEVSTSLIHELIAGARSRVVIQTPYFVLSRDFERVLGALDESVEVIVSTNSLAATDAWPVYAISRRQHHRMVGDLGIHLHEVRPFPADLAEFNRRYRQLVRDREQGFESPMRTDTASATRDSRGPRVSVHAKILVVDDEIAVVTSHNFDPRSERFNTENGIVVHDPSFARALSDYVETIAAPRNSWTVAMRPEGPPVIGPVNRGLARASRRLPTLDVWPWYLTDNYDVDPLAEPLDPTGPGVQDRHEAVGMSPEVVLLRRLLATGFVSRFFGFLRPIM